MFKPPEGSGGAEVKPPRALPSPGSPTPAAEPWNSSSDGNANEGCQDISAQRSLANDRHLNAVLSCSTSWKIIGLDFDQELCFIPSSHQLCGVPDTRKKHS